MNKIWIIAVMVFAFACNQNDNKQAQINNIDRLTETVKTVNYFTDNPTVDSLMNGYKTFIKTYPNDELSATYQFKLAEFYGAQGKTQMQLQAFETAHKNYPNYNKAPQALFMQAFIYETQLGDKQKAEGLYKQFLEKYPEHDFADDAQVSLDNLYLTDEELAEKYKTLQNAE